jgi:hypothetical protein
MIFQPSIGNIFGQVIRILSPPSLSLRLRQNNRPYGYRGLKIFTSLKRKNSDSPLTLKYNTHAFDSSIML